MLVELKPPPQRLFDDSAPETGLANYLRFRLTPNPQIALAAQVKRAGEQYLGDQRELSLVNAEPDQEQTYARLLGDALAGEGALFTTAETAEAAWTVVDPILEIHPRAHPYQPGSWGPIQASDLIAAHACWHDPGVDPEPLPSVNAHQGRPDGRFPSWQPPMIRSDRGQ